MKKYLVVLVLAITVLACKSKKEASASAPATPGTTTGKVSHRFKSTGCNTVIAVMMDGTETLLIPKEQLKKEFDVDGMEITFNYHTLKMKNPEGCSAGIPAEITDVAKK